MSVVDIIHSEGQKRRPLQELPEPSRTSLRCIVRECEDFWSTRSVNDYVTSDDQHRSTLKIVNLPRSVPNSPRQSPGHYHAILSGGASVPTTPVTHKEDRSKNYQSPVGQFYNPDNFPDIEDEWPRGNGSIRQTPQNMIVTPTGLLPYHGEPWSDVTMSVGPISSQNERHQTRRGDSELLSENAGTVEPETYCETSFSLQYVLPARILEITMEALKTDDREIYPPNINYFGKLSLSSRGQAKRQSQNIVMGQTVHFKCTCNKMATGMHLTLQMMTKALTCTGYKAMGEGSLGLDTYDLSSRTLVTMNLIQTRTERSVSRLFVYFTLPITFGGYSGFASPEIILDRSF